MKSSTIALLFVAGASARPQADPNQLPACAKTAVVAALSSSTCPLTDTACLCTASPFITKLAESIQQFCHDPTDVQTAMQYGQAYCANTGVSPTTESTSAPAMTAPAMTTTTTIAVISAMTATSTLSSSIMTVAETSTDAREGPATTSAVMATYTGGASVLTRVGAKEQVILGAVAGVFFVL